MIFLDCFAPLAMTKERGVIAKAIARSNPDIVL